MLSSWRNLIALASIALVALDGVLAVQGHALVHEVQQGTAAAAPAHSHCGHLHTCHSHPSPDSPLPASDSDSHSHDADDCSLCRHFNQPVVVASFAVVLAGQELLAALVPPAPSGWFAVVSAVYPARGPPHIAA